LDHFPVHTQSAELLADDSRSSGTGSLPLFTPLFGEGGIINQPLVTQGTKGLFNGVIGEPAL